MPQQGDWRTIWACKTGCAVEAVEVERALPAEFPDLHRTMLLLQCIRLLQDCQGSAHEGSTLKRLWAAIRQMMEVEVNECTRRLLKLYMAHSLPVQCLAHRGTR